MYETLKSKSDFDNVYKKGKSFGNRDFNLRFIKNSKNENRFGIVVSKKVSKRAVVRNKLRRQIKNFLILQNKRFKQGYDFIILAKPCCKDKKYQELKRSLEHLFYKKGLYQKYEKSSPGTN